MDRFGAAWLMVIKRGLAHWRLLSAVVVGVLLASAIMSGTTIYFEALRELALRKTIEMQSPTDLDIVLKAERGPTDRIEQQKISRSVERATAAWSSWFTQEQFEISRSSTFFLADVGSESSAGQDNKRAYFAYTPSFGKLTKLSEGSLPRDNAVIAEEGILAIEVLIPDDVARQLDIGVGERFSTVPYWLDTVPYTYVVVTGIFHRNDASHPLWKSEGLVLDAATGPSFITAPFYVSEKTFFDTLGATFRDMNSTYAWVLDVAPDRFRASNTEAARASIQMLEQDLSSQLFSYQQFTQLDSVLGEYDQRLFYTKLPMIIILILIAFVILYYVLTLSALLVEQQSGEITLLRSRGAGPIHLLTVFALEGGTIAVIGAIFGPLIASAAISVAGYTPAFSDLTEGAALSTTISGVSYAMSALGGVFSFGALMIPAVGIARSSVSQQRHDISRPTKLPFFQRYYLDVLLLVFSMFLFRQLTEQGSLIATQVFGDTTVNQMLLAVPAISLLAAALVLLRLFPILMALVSKLFSRWMPVGLVLAIWNMARNPTHYARLALLLILASGLGIFAASFGGTLERNFKERALYSSGGHIRMEGLVVTNFGETEPVAPAYEANEGVEGVAMAYRGYGYDASKIVGEDFTFLALDGKSAANFVWSRSDFSTTPIPDLLRSLQSPTIPEGILIQEDATSIGISIKPDRPHPSTNVSVRLLDTNGRWFTRRLGQLNEPNWVTLETPILVKLSRWGRNRLKPSLPVKFMSISIIQANTQEGLLPGNVQLRDLYIRTGEVIRDTSCLSCPVPEEDQIMDTTNLTVLEAFNSTEGWNILRVTPPAIADSLESVSGQGRSSASSVQFSWFEGPSLTARGIYFGPKLQPLPIIVNSAFLDATGHSIGDAFDILVSSQRLKVQIAGTLNYFPSLDTENELIVIADYQSTLTYANLDPRGSSYSDTEMRPNEVWIGTSLTGTERERLIESIKRDPHPVASVYDLEELRTQQSIDPLTRAGWRSLLFIAFGAVLILSCVGFIIHAYVSFRNRRIQFALLRTVGLSSVQLIVTVFVEQAFVVAAGIALGGWMGGRIGALVMPFFANDDRGSQILPPFVIQVDWPILLITYGIMVFVFAVATVGVIMFARRISVAKTLRLGEL